MGRAPQDVAKGDFWVAATGRLDRVRYGSNGPTAGAAVRHAARGLLWVLWVALALDLDGGAAVPLLVIGLLCPACYEMGWRVSRPGAMVEPTQIGELVFGALIALGLALSIPTPA